MSSQRKYTPHVLTKTVHTGPYAAISPLRPELSQKGHVVLVTGGSAGIGFAIARSFAKAGAATVILLGRRQDRLQKAVSELEAQFPETKFIGRQIDVADAAQIQNLWTSLDDEDTVVDVLVLNVARVSPAGLLVDIGRDEVWADFVTNVRANLDFTNYFYHQKKRDAKKKQYLVHVSTAAIHNFEMADQFPNYSVTKSSGTLLLQQVAKGVAPDRMQVIIFHPGAIYTEPAKAAGYPVDYGWDDEDLPGHFAVWAASDEAQFLHGRFVWAAWDVEELASDEIKTQLENPNFLKVGVVGL